MYGVVPVASCLCTALYIAKSTLCIVQECTTGDCSGGNYQKFTSITISGQEGRGRDTMYMGSDKGIYKISRKARDENR